MTTIDNKYNTLVFDGTTATLTITHKKPRNHKTKVEFGSHTISYGAITSARLATAGFTVHGYQIVLDPPLPEVGTQFDLYGVWIRRAEQKAFEAAIHQADKYELSEPWDAPQVDNVGTRLAANVKKTENSRKYTFGDITITGDGTLTYKTHEFPTTGAHATVDQSGVQQKVGAGRVIGGMALAGHTGAMIGGMAKKTTGDITLTVQLADGRTLATTAPVSKLKQAQDVASRINDAGLELPPF